MQTLRKKNSPCKFKKEPTRFLGEGVSFKAKLIGILEVSEARGDRMCQAALADLKMAIRAAGEHKQRIAVQVSIDGLRLRDEKTGECLYHHPVHKISFIAQDMSDSRAFGYIFGSPDTGHRFFGIKTDKAANQVVIAMRDLFQVVFELKKKEIELAKQHIEQNAMKFHTSIFVEPAPDTKGAAGAESSVHRMRSTNILDVDKSSEKKPDSRSGVIADLLDLQFELNSLQQGIHQLEKSTPESPRPSAVDPFESDPFESDPFGDSFANMKVKPPTQPILPPPPSSVKRVYLERQPTVPTPSSSTSSPATVMPSKTSPPPSSMRWAENDSEKQFCDGEIANLTSTSAAVSEKETKSDQDSRSSSAGPNKSPQVDVFTELDPLGTGLSKPYIDKKDFFQHLKNPPKKLLKDLVSNLASETFPTIFDLSLESLDPVPIVTDKPADAFEDGNFADFDKFEAESSAQAVKARSPSRRTKSIHHQPLSVCLPPEDITTKIIPTTCIGMPEREGAERLPSVLRLPSPSKHTRKRDFDVDLTRTHSIDKPFPVDFSSISESPASPLRSGSSEANSRLSSSSAELDIVPEPPPRGAGSIVINPPPLPPKKQAGRLGNKPPPRPPHSDGYFHYDFIERETSPSPTRRDRTETSPEFDSRRRFDDDFTSSMTRTAPESSESEPAAAQFEDSFSSNMIPTTLSSLFQTSYDAGGKVKKKASLDITLSQLTSSNLAELASNLDMTVSELTSLTLQQLTECLAKLSSKESQPTPTETRTAEPFVTEEPPFVANFDQKPENTYDKYAVFRELFELEQVKVSESIGGINDFNRRDCSLHDEEVVHESHVKMEYNIKLDEVAESSNLDPSTPEEEAKKADDEEDDDEEEDEEGEEQEDNVEVSRHSLKSEDDAGEKLSEDEDQDKIEANNLNIDEGVLEIDENPVRDTTEEVPAEVKSEPTSTDRYAALRDIVADMDSRQTSDEKPPSIAGSTSEPAAPEIDLMKLFSAPQSPNSSPKKTQENSELSSAAMAEYFEGIIMLNTILQPASAGFEDIFCPSEPKTKDAVENGRKFDAVFHSDKSSYEGHGSLGGTSPWSPDEKEFHKGPATFKTADRHSGDSDNEWKDEEESEESNGRLRDDGFWRDPRFGPGCEEGMYYDDPEKERHFRGGRKPRGGPWKAGHRRPDSSPWQEDVRWEEEHRRYGPRKIPYVEESKAHWKPRGPRPPWNGDREFRDHPLYEEDRGKRRMMLWSEDDRFSSQESMGYDDEERWSRYERGRWDDDGHFWPRRGGGGGGGGSAAEGDYPVMYRKPYYCRPDYPPNWEADYGLERPENAHRYLSTRKRHWPKRPNSANDERSLEAVYTESRMKYGVSRSECSDNDSDPYHRPCRSRSRESYWGSDQEFDNWGERSYYSEGPDSKAENLQRRRMNRHKPVRPAKQSSPFENDFTQALEHGQVTMDAFAAETTIRTEDTKPVSPREARKDARYKRSSYFEDDLTPSVSSDASDRQRLGSDVKRSSDDPAVEAKDRDGFAIDDSRDSYFSSDPRFDDDAFSLKAEMADRMPDSGLSIKNRQLKYGNNKIKGDHDIKKSESVNIFVRENDPFDDDDFFN